MSNIQSPGRVTVETIDVFCTRALDAVGVPTHHARQIADVLVVTDTWGVHTHGLKLLPGYIRRIREGGLRTEGEPSIRRDGPSWGIVDGHCLPAQVTSQTAMRLAMEKAGQTGVGYVGVMNSCHFGAAGCYAWMAAREGMIGLAMANDVPSVAAPGSRQAVLGSNPIAYAIPAGRYDPIILDMSIATVAGGKVYARCKLGEPIPEGWLIGPDGQPTTNGALYPQQTSLSPVGAHKGYGIGMLIETLSAVLTGAAVTHGVGSWLFDDGKTPTNHGAAFLAIDAATVFGGDEFFKRVEALIDEIHSAPTADSCDRLLVPGEREWKYRKSALENGMELPQDVRDVLATLAADLDIPFAHE
jgi:ureidoglycolate dehydrogenase (NAD+)